MNAIITPYTITRETKAVWKAVGCPTRGRALWLQRMLFWILRKLKAEYITHEDTYERVVIDTRKVEDIILRNNTDIWTILNNHPAPKYVVIGHRELKEITDIKSFSPRPLQFHLEFPDKGRLRVFGLDVIIVPWIDGCFVLPDLEQIIQHSNRRQ